MSLIKNKALPTNVQLERTNVRISDLSNALAVVGTIKLQIELRGVKIPVLFFVIEDWKLSVDMILGMNFLNSVNAKIDFDKMLLGIKFNRNHNSVPLIDLSAQDKTFLVHCTETIPIRGGMQQGFWAKATCPDGYYVLGQRTVYHPSLFVADAVIKVENGAVPISIMNISESDVSIKKNTAIAEIDVFHTNSEV